MSKLSALCGKYSKEITLGEEPNEIKIKLKLLKTEDLDELFEMMNESNKKEQDSGKQFQKMISLIKKTLRQSVPDATEDEIDEIAFVYSAELSEKIMDMFNSIFDKMSFAKKKEIMEKAEEIKKNQMQTQ